MKTAIARLAAAAIALAASRAALAWDAPGRPRLGLHVSVGATVPVLLPAPVLRVHEGFEVAPVGPGFDGRWDRDEGRDHGRWERERRERERRDAWRAAEQARIRAEYARLDDARADFYGRPHRRWDVRRFEAWYASARAELDQRWNRVSWVAAR